MAATLPHLIVALSAFVGTHFLLSHPLRTPLAARLGERGFQLLYTVVAFATLIWAVQVYRAVPPGAPLWPVPESLWTLATVIMLAASVLLLGSVVRNPALAMPGGEAAAKGPARGVFAITRHPMMWSFALWALAHALVAPRIEVIVLCGAIAFLALVGAAGQDVKKARLMGDAWRDWAARTSYLPFGGQLSGRIAWRDAVPGMHALGGGLIVWLIASWAHPLLGAGMTVGPWRWF